MQNISELCQWCKDRDCIPARCVCKKCHTAPEANEKTCEMCNGTGYITRDDYDTRTGEHVQVESRCPCNPKILQDEYTDD